MLSVLFYFGVFYCIRKNTVPNHHLAKLDLFLLSSFSSFLLLTKLKLHDSLITAPAFWSWQSNSNCCVAEMEILTSHRIYFLNNEFLNNLFTIMCYTMFQPVISTIQRSFYILMELKLSYFLVFFPYLLIFTGIFIYAGALKPCCIIHYSNILYNLIA